MDIQEMIDEENEKRRKHLSETQMTLGELIKALRKFPEAQAMRTLSWPHSYRGYYTDLAFEYQSHPVENTLVIANLSVLESCVGRKFTRYEGDDFVMDVDTPLWIANYGSCGVRIMDIDPETAELILKEAED